MYSEQKHKKGVRTNGVKEKETKFNLENLSNIM